VRIIPIKRVVSINCNNTGKIKFCSENRSIVRWYRTKLKKGVMPNQNTTESGQLRGGVCIAWMGTPR
jgi:hypothetical protein